MARTPEKRTDSIVDDLQTIRRLDWSQPEGFAALETLLAHPLVKRVAKEPKGRPELVEALKAVLEEVVDRIRSREGPKPRDGRSVADAGTALLRLEPRFAAMSLEQIRNHIVQGWRKPDGGKLSPQGFRQHLEVPQVYEPLAREFRHFAETQAAHAAHAEGNVFPSFSVPPIRSDWEERGQLAFHLAELETRNYHRRLANLEEGFFPIRTEEEMFEVLVEIAEGAEHEYHAIDPVDVGEWFSSRKLNSYLLRQLKRVEEKEVTLTRIRIIYNEDELRGLGRRREQLDELIELHDSAGAELLLCRSKALADIEHRFTPHLGLFIADSKAAPVAVTGELSQEGSIGTARAYLSDTDMVKELLEEYEKLEAIAVNENNEVRAGLTRLH